MRVFVTGASGYVGGAIVSALVRAGHRVSGLSRSPQRDAVVKGLGAEPVRGDLRDLTRIGPALAGHDAYVHAAFDYASGPVVDRAALDALLAAARAAGPQRRLVYTSGVWVLGECRRPTGEDGSTASPAAIVAWRPAHERVALEAATPDLATAVIRPGMVWGERRGIVNRFCATAAEEGAAAYVGTGENRWPPVHRDDLAALYVLVLERQARGVFHGVDGSAVQVKDIAASIAAAAGRGTRAIPLDEARRQMGALADALAMDQVVIAPRSAELGWKPARPRFPDAGPTAFAEWKAG